MRRRLAAARRLMRPPSAEPAQAPPPEPAGPPDAPDAGFVATSQLLAVDLNDTAHIRRLVAWVVGPEDSCIDIGAHRGSVLEQIVAVAPHGRHVAFEPIPHLVADLAERFPDVDVRHAALSDHPGESTFAHVRAAEPWSGLKYRPLPGDAEGDVEQIVVPLEVLDDVLPGDFVPRFVKLDVEGAEQQVIEGGLRTLATHKPILVFEHGLGSANAYGTEPDDIHRLLCGEAGMRIFDLDGGGPYTLDEFRRTYYAAERVNFVAHA
jgi:FkbM family methyltransferase